MRNDAAEVLRGIAFTRGPNQHTFTAIGRCPRTGRLGVAVTTGEIATGSRVPSVMANVGAVGTQASTDPRLGPLAIKLLELGYPAARVMSELEASDPYIEFRQLGVVDRFGRTAVRTGSSNNPWAGHETGDGWVVMGNAVVDEGVVAAMAQAMREHEARDIETRLMHSISAGTDAGGQPDGQRAAAVVVLENEGYPIVNLRVDDHDEPMKELWRVFNKMRPRVPYYRKRPDDPTLGRVVDWKKKHGIE